MFYEKDGEKGGVKKESWVAGRGGGVVIATHLRAA